MCQLCFFGQVASQVVLNNYMVVPYHLIHEVPSGDRPGEIMAKGEQRSNKMAKKPKKDNSPPKPGVSDRPTPPVTVVLPRGKEKK